MTPLAPSVAQNIASWFRVTLGTLIDAVIIIVLSFLLFDLIAGTWGALSGASVEAPVIGFMSDYSRPAQNGYGIIVLLSIILAIVLNTASTFLIGASIGKAILGVKFVSFDGGPPRLTSVLKKSLFNIGLFLLAALPGPIIGFIFGSAADSLSLLSLFAALIFALVLGSIPSQNGLLAAYRWSEIAPVVRRKVS